MPAIKLKLNGKGFDLKNAGGVMMRLQAFLDAAPTDELFDSMELAQRVETDRNNLTSGSIARNPKLSAYSARIGSARYWGNPKAIAELKRQTQAMQ